MSKIVLVIGGLTTLFCFSSCNKYLEEKSKSKLVIPSTVKDLQALLDFDFGTTSQPNPSASEASADNYYLTLTDWNSFTTDEQRRIYTWEKDNVFPMNNNEWDLLYRNAIYRANTALDILPKIERTGSNQTEWDNVKGNAHFVRGMAFLKAAFVWTLAYDENSAAIDLGLPLRTISDFNVASVRSTVQETYQQIIQDFREAVVSLPVIPLHVFRPSKPAAYAALARTYLSMRQYDSCLKYANLCLGITYTLMDYNGDPAIVPTAAFPFARFNPEVIMESSINQNLTITMTKAKIDSGLYRSYSSNDLRKTLFFRSNGNDTYGFQGSYNGQSAAIGFDGIATDEVYLMQAECLTRTGDFIKGMESLNLLLRKRYKSNSFNDLIAGDKAEALAIILQERRKELVYRQLRFMDIKRLNKEGANIVQQRILDGRVFTLSPNDLRYALPIPEIVITVSGMPQNPR